MLGLHVHVFANRMRLSMSISPMTKYSTSTGAEGYIGVQQPGTTPVVPVDRQKAALTKPSDYQVEPATGSDKVYQTIVNFHLTHYDIMDGIIQYTRTRIIGML
jgi:hypothetical protein